VEEREKKQINVKPDWITVHTPPRKEKNAEINLMIRQEHGCEYQSQQHKPSEGNKAVDTVTCNEHINFFLILFWKRQNYPIKQNNNNKKKLWNYHQAPKIKVKNFYGKENEVIMML